MDKSTPIIRIKENNSNYYINISEKKSKNREQTFGAETENEISKELNTNEIFEANNNSIKNN